MSYIKLISYTKESLVSPPTNTPAKGALIAIIPKDIIAFSGDILRILIIYILDQY